VGFRLAFEKGNSNQRHVSSDFPQILPEEWRIQDFVPPSPKSAATIVIAAMQKAMCSSRSMPRSAAPLMMSSRLTLRAKALSFIFLRTDLASTSASDLLGLTSAEAVMKPEISSQA